jgi:hypothetical protein
VHGSQQGQAGANYHPAGGRLWSARIDCDRSTGQGATLLHLQTCCPRSNINAYGRCSKPHASCEHVFFGASCLEGRLELFRTGEALQCPVCRRLVRAVYADPDSFVLTLLAQSARPPVARAAQPRGHAHYSLQFKAKAVKVWDSASWSMLHNLHPHLPWSTADYWRRNPACE